MVKIDTFLDKFIEKKFNEKTKERENNHKSSGKLSASMLGQPLQWQVLKVLGMPQKELDEYTTRKFFRGSQIEDWAVGEMPNVIERQKKIEYRNCIGFADALVDTKDWDFKLGIIPIEIKSVANMKFKRITQNGGPDKGHILQACYYALGLKKEHFAVIYVASDDLRIQTYIFDIKDWKDEIDGIIDLFNKAMEAKTIPLFEAKEKWQTDKKYCNYPDFMDLTEKELQLKYKELKQ